MLLPWLPARASLAGSQQGARTLPAGARALLLGGAWAGNYALMLRHPRLDAEPARVAESALLLCLLRAGGGRERKVVCCSRRVKYGALSGSESLSEKAWPLRNQASLK